MLKHIKTSSERQKLCGTLSSLLNNMHRLINHFFSVAVLRTPPTMPDYNGNDFLEKLEDEDCLMFMAIFECSIETGECIVGILIWLLHFQKGYSMTRIILYSLSLCEFEREQM